MRTVFFHIEVEDCLYYEGVVTSWDEFWTRSAELEMQAIEHASQLFGRPVTAEGRRSTDGALICSFTTNSLADVREIVKDNTLVEGNDQIISGVEYVIVRDFLPSSIGHSLRER